MSPELFRYIALFLLSASVVVTSGLLLVRSGDALARGTGWGHIWVGGLLISGTTSLPELVTNAAALRLGLPELALADLLGANMANMLFMGLIGLLVPGRQLLQRVSPQQGGLATLAIALTTLAVLLGVLQMGAAAGWVGLGSLVLLAIYIIGMRLLYLSRPQPAPESSHSVAPPRFALRRAWAIFGVSALGILVSAPLLAYSVGQISEITGLSTTFLGVAILALLTALPELVTTLEALRLGATDMLVSNLYGSAAFNMAILGFLDLVYTQGSLYLVLNPGHTTAGLVAVVMMSLALGGILLRPPRRQRLTELAAPALMTFLYPLGVFAVYRASL